MREGQAIVLVSLGAPAGAQVARQLRERGFHVAERGGAAPQVVVADLASAAAWTASSARAADPPPELVVVAAPDRLGDAVALLRGPASDVLAEPVDAAVVVGAVERAFARRRAALLPGMVLSLARAATPPRVAASVAHEIANPVAVLLSALSAIEGDLAELGGAAALLAPGAALSAAASWWADAGRAALADATDAVSEAVQASERLKHLARDLRSIVRADPVAHAPMDLAEAAAVAVRLARPALAPFARLSVETPPGMSAVGSPGAVARIVLELLLRAADALAAADERGGHVRVGCRVEADHAVVEVEDDAPTGDAEPLAQALAGRLPPGAPAGHAALGLAVARDLAERQGGTLAARPRTPARGTVFELRLRR